MDFHSVVGRSLPKVDGLDKVTGQAIYAIDFKLPGMLEGKLLRSPLPHARVVEIDVGRARSLAGVKAVVTAQDVAGGLYGPSVKDRPILPKDVVRHVGEPLAAVAALDEDTALEALSLIEVEYEELPAVFDPVQAMEPDAPLIHPELASYGYNPLLIRPVGGTNICNHFKLRQGNVEQGFAKAEHLFEDTFTLPMVHHCYMESSVSVASTDATGKITVWSNTQAPYGVREDLADGLKLPLNKIRVITPKVGGGFGGRCRANIEPYAALLSQRTGRPVRMILSRAEAFTATTVRHPAIVKIKTGVHSQGKLTAREMTIIWDTGAYADLGPNVSRSAGYSAAGPYETPHVKIDSYCVYTNNPVAGAFRGFGVAQTAWAVESQMDIIAHRLGMDPLTLRLINCYKEGSLSATGEVLESVGVRECLERTATKIDWSPATWGKGQGQGIACIYKFTRPFAPSCAFVKINEDGSVGVITSAVDIGQGSDTVLAQMAAEEFGLKLSEVQLAGPDTDVTPFDVGTLSSRVTFHVGNAVRLAAQDAKAQLFRLAAEELEANPEDLVLSHRKVYVQGAPQKGITLAQLAALSHTFRGGPILGRGSFLTEGLTPLDPETGQGSKPTEYWEYAAQAANVKVEEETGEVTVLEVAAANDVGFAINPLSVESQIQGAVLIGLGTGLMEEMHLDSGRVVNPSFLDYAIPTAMDAPDIKPLIVETAHKDGPFGAKGLGEGPTPPTAPALANAIFAATGIRIKELPLTPERIYQALKKRSPKGG